MPRLIARTGLAALQNVEGFSESSSSRRLYRSADRFCGGLRICVCHAVTSFSVQDESDDDGARGQGRSCGARVIASPAAQPWNSIYDAAITHLTTVDESLAQIAFVATLSGFLGGLALLLAAVGL